VLLLEDNPTDVFVINDVLASSGLDVELRVVGNGRDALDYFHGLDQDPSSPCPSLILLDLNLPAVDGIEILRRIRGGVRLSHTPVIVVTSSSAESDRAAAQRLAAEAYFEKPKDLTAYMKLAQVIRDVLRAPNERKG
jgi:CheY-like chemotaxis protein